MDPEALRAALFEAGYRPVPVYTWNWDTVGAGKRPLGNEWQIEARKPIPFCVTHRAVPHALNTGILCDGLRAVDIDIDDPDRADKVKSLAIEMLGDAPMRWRGNSPRLLLAYRAAEGEPSKRHLTGEGHSKEHSNKIEILGLGNQFVGFGTHDSGADLQWHGSLLDTPRDTLPAVAEDQITAFLKAAAPIIGAAIPNAEAETPHRASETIRADCKILASAMTRIPNETRNWDDWNRIGMALFAATDGADDGLLIFDQWSRKCSEAYQAASCAARWASYRASPPSRIGAGTIFYLAGQNGWKQPVQQEPYHPGPAPVRPPVTESRTALREAIADFFNHVTQPNLFVANRAIRAQVGTGKSATTRLEIARALTELRARGDRRSILVTVPMHRLGNDQAREFDDLPETAKAGLVAQVWRGREAVDPMQTRGSKVVLMCHDIEAVKEAQAVHANVQESVCRRGSDQCKHFQYCGYQRQLNLKADLWIAAHQVLFSEKPKNFGDLASVVVDESMWQAGLFGLDGRNHLTIDELGADCTVPGSPDDTDYLRHIRGLAFEALRHLPDGPIKRDAMVAGYLTEQMAHDALKIEWKRKITPAISPGMPPAERKAAAEAARANRILGRLSAFWHAMASLLAEDGPEASGNAAIASVADKDGTVRVIRLKGRREISKGFKVPTLMIDATYRHELAQPYYPGITLVADIIAETPHQSIRQSVGKTYSKSSLLGPDDAPLKAKTTRANNIRKLHASLCKLARSFAPNRILAVGQKDVEDALKERGNLPGNLDLQHFNNIRGLDTWKDVPLIAVIGRTLPAPGAVETIAEALIGAAIEPIQGRYPQGQRQRLFVAGGWTDALAEYHPNAVAEAVRAAICDDELEQVVGRGRGVNRSKETRLEVIVLTNVVMESPIDEILDPGALEPSPADMMSADAGIALASPAHAAKAFPHLWPSEDAAKKAWQREDGDKRLYIYSIGECPRPLGAVTYRLTGPGMKEKTATFDPAICKTPATWLTERLGPLASCTVTIETEQEGIEPGEAYMPFVAIEPIAEIWTINKTRFEAKPEKKPTKPKPDADEFARQLWSTPLPVPAIG